MALRIVTCCLLLVLAGCAGLPGGSGPTDRTASPTPTPVMFDHTQLAARVEVQAFQAPPVRIVATEQRTNRTVVNESHNGTFTVEYDDDAGPFEANTTYRIVIHVAGEVAWQRTVNHYEGYTLRVGENGNVTLQSHAMA